MSMNQPDNQSNGNTSLIFDPEAYSVLSLAAGDQTITARAYENIVYVTKPVDIEHQVMNIYIPEAYFNGGTINGYLAETAPIFFPNAISQYRPATPLIPRFSKRTDLPNASLVALTKGYVVVSPALRGHTSQDEDGHYVGKAPACIIDMKACVRYLRYNDKRMPGDTEKIIPNGFSAGGAVSALLGASGNNPDYAPYLSEIGAAEERDDVFAVLCYCPVYNLENLDIGYEWNVKGVTKYGFRGEAPKELSAEQLKISNELCSLFPAYINNLDLKAFDHVNAANSGHGKARSRLEAGTPLQLDANGEGTYKDFGKSLLIASAQKALDAGMDMSEYNWLSISPDGVVTDFDLDLYKKNNVSRMRPSPVFDDPARSTAECLLFGTETVNSQHHTEHGLKYGSEGGSMADAYAIKLMNPLLYIDDPGSTAAKHWRIRHGTRDFGHMLTNPVILGATLQNRGFDTDLAFAWEQGHAGDYDIDELFDWIESVCRQV